MEGLPETPNRLALVAIVFSVAFFLAFAAAPPVPAGAFPILHAATGAAIVASAVVFGLTRRHRDRPRLLIDVAIAYEVFACLVIGLAEHWQPWGDAPIRGISWISLVLVTFPLAVAAPPDRTLVASIVGASMSPLALAIRGIEGAALPPAKSVLALVLPTYLAAGIAYVLSRALHHLGTAAERARRMGNYELVRALGSGGMGEVWLAHHRLLERPVAVKLVRPDVITREVVEDADTVFRRFEREARTIASLTSPHTIQLFDYGIAEDGAFYYVMELLDGLDLETLVAKFGPMPAERVIHVLVQIAASLDEAHERGLIHRDVKPANVYLCRLGGEHDFVKVLDFGLVITSGQAVEQLTRLTTDGLTSGTPAYMAPELATGAPDVDGRADIYGMGCLAYFLITGRMVFESPSMVRMLADHIETQPTPPSQRTELTVPEDLEALILACLEKNPDRRPKSARELAASLRRCAGSSAWTPERAERWWRTHVPPPEPPASRDPPA
jgi:serine/threonine-protein kinase